MSSGPSKLDLDVSNYVKGMQQALAWTLKYAAGMKSVAVTSLEFNREGKKTDATVELIAKSGEKVLASLKKIKGGYEVTSATIKKSLADITKANEEAAKAASQKANAQNLTDFRRSTGTGIQKNIFPKGGQQQDYRQLFGDLSGLEGYIRKGEITAKRAQTLIQEIQLGASKRVTGSAQQEAFRLDALKLFQDAQVLKDKITKQQQKAAGATNAPKVQGFLDGIFGKIDPAATSTQTRRVEASFIQLQKIVKETGIDFTRFQDLVTKSMTGVADPVTVAERRITQALARIRTDFQGAKDLSAKNAAKIASTQEAKNIGDFLKKSLNTSGLDDRSLERVYAQIARIQNLVARGPGQNGLSGAQFTKVWNAITTGAKTSFMGAEEQARASMAKIQNIIKGSLNNPFEVNITLGNSFHVIKSMIAANFALELLEKFKSLVDEAAEFQRAIALIQTITQDADMSFNQWASGIRRVSDELGKPVIEIASAGYDLLSNQVTHAADTFDVLSTAGQFARITNSNTEDSVNLLSTAINTFRLNASDAQRVADEFFTVIDLGRVKAQGLANSGRTFEFGKTIGASIQDINASLITLTQSGIKEDTAMTLLNNVFQKLLNPTKELQAVYDKLGVSTGENFVKTYGWAGAMKKLKEETGGSSAKLADLFNEIRGYQGVSNLIDRIDILTDSYKAFEHSAENAAKAKKNFDDLPGQQYLEQTNKIKNAFTLGFKTILLKDVLAVGNAFGGLDVLLKHIIQTTGALAIGIASALAIEKVLAFTAAAKEAQGVVLLLEGALSGGLWTVGVGAATGALTFLIYKLIEAETRTHHLFDTISDELEKIRRKADAEDTASRSRQVAGFEKDMDKKKQVLLEFAAVARQGLDKQAEALDKSGASLGETLKNSLELLLSSVKTSLQEVINAQTAALRSIKDLKKEKNSLGAERSSALFDFNKARLGTANAGGLNEKALYQSRIDELKKQAVKAANSGDRDNAINAAKEIENLTSELASKTVEVNGVNYLKYYGQEQAINEALTLRSKLIDILIAKRKQESDALEGQRKTEAERVAEAEDAAKSLYSFKLTDEKTGKQLYKSPAEVEAELDKREKRFRDATAGFRGHNALESEELIEKRREKAHRDLLNFRGDRSARSAVGAQQDLNTNTVATINERLGDGAKARLKEIQKAADESGKAFGAASDEVQKYFGTFKENDPNKFPRDPKTGVLNKIPEREPLLTNIDNRIKSRNYDQAIRDVEKLIALYTKLGIEQREGYLGPDAKVMTARESLITIRARLAQAKDAETQHRADQDALVAIGGQSEQAQGAVDILIGKYGDLSSASSGAAKELQADFSKTTSFVNELVDQVKRAVTEMDNLSRSLKAARDNALNPTTSTDSITPKKKWMGGDVGYFSDGGSISDFMSGKYASGTDTIPIMASKGEFVINAQSASRFKSQLIAMNSGFDPGSSGAHGSTTNVGDIHVHVKGGENSQQTVREIAAGLRREMRRGTIKFGS